jgi:Ca2+-binding EF-hand superfamily protein
MFRIIDDDGGRSLSMDEFIKGCHDFGATLGKNELTALFKSMDVNDSGTIDFEEFLIALRVSVGMM